VSRKNGRAGGLLIGLAVLIWLSTPRLNAATDDSAEIKQLSSDYRTALLTRDIKFLNSIIAPDEVNVGANGQPFDKQAFIAKIENPSFSYKKVEVPDLVVQVVGDMALTRGTATATSERSGVSATDNFRFVRIWQRIGGRWQVTYFQATNVQA
jgi:ketosteroid isomerase-like protein